jgi:hypothetical protein
MPWLVADVNLGRAVRHVGQDSSRSEVKATWVPVRFITEFLLATKIESHRINADQGAGFEASQT